MGGAGKDGARRSKVRGGGRSSASSGNGLQGTGRPPEGLGGTLVALGARRDARVGRRRAETVTATWTAARGFGHGGEEGYSMRAAKRREGNGGGAHRGCSGRRSGLGDALETANRRRWWSEPEEEDDGDGGSTGRPASCGLTESFRARGRSSCASREGEGRPVAAAMANGGDGCVRTRERESEGEERKNRGRVREYGGGGAWRRSRASRRGGERQAGRRAGGVARWRARAPGTLPSLCRGRRRQRRRRAGPPAGWAGQLLLGCTGRSPR